MTRITYIEPSGQAIDVDVTEGWSLMQAAIANGVDGIVGECGGSCACATCHCYVDETRLASLPPPSAGELDMLANVAAERRPNSRLACQLKAGPALEGLVLTLPDQQE
jgi:ferredoxin, 2Fe-2S